ncbi:MAG: SRPBCC family protein [Bacillota bacterium]
MARCVPIDESFFATAPESHERTWVVPQSAEEFWADFIDRPLHWTHGLRIRWTSARPFGVGTTRHVGILGLIQADEHFFAWEEGRRCGFYFTNANLPVFRSFGEFYDVEPIDAGTCRFTWRLAAEPAPMGKAMTPVTRVLLASLFRDTDRHVRSLAAA